MLDHERQLIDRLRRIEALFAGTEYDGERAAAAAAMERIRQRLRSIQESDPPVEYKFSLADGWSKRLFLALLRRYDVRPYRYSGQRRNTIMARVPKCFVDETLWPEYVELNNTLRRYLDDVTERVITECIHRDGSDADVAESGPPALAVEPNVCG